MNLTYLLMENVKNILRKTSHRPIPMPEGNWRYYQEWQSVIFAHWRVPVESLRKLVPKGLEIDLYNGEAWISLVAFTLKDLRLHYLPSFPPVSDFHEINMRTYVLRNNKPGIYFLSLEAQKTISTLIARLVIGLNYYKSEINYQPGYLESENLKQLFYVRAMYNPGADLTEKNEIDRWLTDRFCLFHELSGKIFSHDIHHQDWPLRTPQIKTFEVNYRYKDLLIKNSADLYHYSDGVQVPTWGKMKA
jgi:uncharacterized protein